MRFYIQRMVGTANRPQRLPIAKIIWSTLASFVGMLAIAYGLSMLTLDVVPSGFLIGSFGATAVLLYGAPRAEFSQPRNVIGGHVLSALIGVAVFKFTQFDLLLSAAIAVSLSIMLMQLTHTMHPPGGATALIAIIGGESVHQLGWYYAITPVFTGALIMTLVALFFNNLSRRPERHYPAYWW